MMQQENNHSVLTLHDEIVMRAISTLQKASRKAERLLKDYRPLLNGERLLTDAELSDILRVSRRTLQEYRNDGNLPRGDWRKATDPAIKGNDIHKFVTFDKQMKEIYQKNVIIWAQMLLFQIFFVPLQPIFNLLWEDFDGIVSKCH